MKNKNKVRGGKLAKQRGEAFEHILESNALRYDWQCIRIPAGGRTVKSPTGQKFLRTRSPFDMIFMKQGKAIFCDAKTIAQNTFPISLIKPHQVDALLKAEKGRFIAGYVVNFSELNITVFYHAHQLQKAIIHKKSLNPDDGVFLGTNTHIFPDNTLAKIWKNQNPNTTSF